MESSAWRGFEMTNARDVMHQGAECIGENDTLASAALKMRDLHAGALPICGQDDRLQGIITDRDIVVRCIALGQDPQTVTARDLAQGTPIWVDDQLTGGLSRYSERRCLYPGRLGDNGDEDVVSGRKPLRPEPEITYVW